MNADLKDKFVEWREACAAVHGPVGSMLVLDLPDTPEKAMRRKINADIEAARVRT